MLTHLDTIRPLLHVDSNGSVDAMTDGLMILRFDARLPQAAVVLALWGGCHARRDRHHELPGGDHADGALITGCRLLIRRALRIRN